MNESSKILQLKNVFLQLGLDYDESELADFSSHFQPKSYKKGDIIQPVGSTLAHLSYITNGMVRLYYTNDDGKEFNQAFKVEHQIYSNYFQTFLNEPSPFAIQALEDTQTLEGLYQDIEAFYEKSRSWERLARKVTEQNYMYKAIRERDLLTSDALTRLENFEKYFPHLKDRVSKHHISLYLGINPASLSRILKQR